MGLFDMLKREKDPLSDLTVKNYFEIICGMRHTFLAIEPEIVTGNEKAKAYVEYFLGTNCDDEKLEKALELYNISRTDYPNGKTETILSDFRKSLLKSTNYTLDRYKATKMFCQKEIEKARIEYDKVLEVIKDNVNYKHYSEGVKKIAGGEIVRGIVIQESFCDGNPITQKIVVEYLIDTIIGRKTSETYCTHSDPDDDIALITLKALHFEKEAKNKENYISITDDDCRKFISEVFYYNSSIQDHPFDKEKYITKYVELIKSRSVFNGIYRSQKEGIYIISLDDYFCDAVCNLLWKEIASRRRWLNKDDKEISDSKKPNDVFNILRGYFDNPNI